MEEANGFRTDITTIRYTFDAEFLFRDRFLWSTEMGDRSPWDVATLTDLDRENLYAADAVRTPLPVQTSLSYPIGRRNSQTTRESLQQAEKTLNIFWLGADEGF